MINVGRVNKNQPHLLADLVELILLFEDRAHFSKSDVQSLLKTAIRDAEDVLNPDDADIDQDDYDDELTEVEKEEIESNAVLECFAQFEFRSKELGAAYPFYVQRDLIKPKSRLRPIHKLYKFLLGCSRTRSFPSKNYRTKLTNHFEVISAQVVRLISSSFANVRIFGVGSDDRKKYYGSNLRKALPRLSRDMGIQLNPGWRKHVKPQGDLGLDIIAFDGLGDNIESSLVLIAQCACSENASDWSKKRAEAMIGNRRGTFSPLVDPIPVLIIAALYRTSEGAWVDTDPVSNVLTLDRLRIIKILQRHEDLALLAKPVHDLLSVA